MNTTEVITSGTEIQNYRKPVGLKEWINSEYTQVVTPSDDSGKIYDPSRVECKNMPLLTQLWCNIKLFTRLFS